MLYSSHQAAYVGSVQKDVWKFCEIQVLYVSAATLRWLATKVAKKTESIFNASFIPYQLNNRPVYLWQGK